MGHVLSSTGATAYFGFAKFVGTYKPERLQFRNYKTEGSWALQAETICDWPAIHLSPMNTEAW